MWPWEHIAVGYIAYSGYRKSRYGRSPWPWAVFAVVLGSVVPDLVDKPLEWTFGLLPSISLGHSILVAIPLGVVVLSVASMNARTDVGGGFVIGYWLHIPCDMIYPLALGLDVDPRSFLWPLYVDSVEVQQGLAKTTLSYLTEFGSFLATPRGTAYLLFEGLLLGVAVALWIDDGMPVVEWLLDWVRQAT